MAWEINVYASCAHCMARLHSSLAQVPHRHTLLDDVAAAQGNTIRGSIRARADGFLQPPANKVERHTVFRRIPCGRTALEHLPKRCGTLGFPVIMRARASPDEA